MTDTVVANAASFQRVQVTASPRLPATTTNLVIDVNGYVAPPHVVVT